MPTTFGTVASSGGGSPLATVIVTVPVWINRRPGSGILRDHGSDGWSEATSTIATVKPTECSVEIAACRSSPMTEGTTSSYEDGSVHTSYAGSEPAGYWSTSMSWGDVYGFARHPRVTSTRRVT